ncbi:histone-lysine N-methyltransferase SETMAR [Trichonephila clavipes]|nr:histone-lysine N-methyltransferase SETMAR [Trichonephila clavipes]
METFVIALAKLQKTLQEKLRALHTEEAFTFEWTFWRLEPGCYSAYVVDSDEDIRLDESDCEESEESADVIDNIPVNPDIYLARDDTEYIPIIVMSLADLRLEMLCDKAVVQQTSRNMSASVFYDNYMNVVGLCATLLIRLHRLRLFPKKMILSACWDVQRIIHWEVLPLYQTINAAFYCLQLDRVHSNLVTKWPSLINRSGVILHHFNAWPHDGGTLVANS